MYLSTFSAIFIAVQSLLFSSTSLEQAQWKLAYNENGIKVYTRTTASGLKEFKGICEVDASLYNLSALIEDVENHKSFIYGVKESAILKRNNDASKFVYSVVDMPWPLDDRDMVSKTNAVHIKSEKQVKIAMKASPSQHPEQEDLVRMHEARGFWQFDYIAEDRSLVTYQFVSDPNNIPNWVVNMFIIDAPKKTLKNLQAKAPSLNYSAGRLPWF